MRRKMLAVLMLAAVVGALGLIVPWPSGASARSGYEPVLNPADFVHAITNPYLPFPVGRTLTYRGVKDGVTQVDVVHVTSHARVLEGITAVAALLEYLMRRPGDVLTRATLVEHVWDFAFDGDPRIVTVYIRSLRDKIDRPFQRSSLETVRGLGYRILDDALGPAAD